RAAFKPAVRALERAAELSADEAGRARRLVDAAWCASLTGADVQAVALAAEAEPLVDHPLQRAGLAQGLGIAEIRRGRPGNAPPLLLEAARDIADLDTPLALQLLLDAGWAANEAGVPAVQVEIGRLAASLSASATDERSVFASHLLTGLAAIAERD